MSVENGIKIEELQPCRFNIKSTEVTVKGKGFWVSTIRIPHGSDFETIVFPEPITDITDFKQTNVPEIAIYNRSHIASEEEAIRNHKEAVAASVQVLRSAK